MKCVNRRGNPFAVLFDDDQFVLTLMKEKEIRHPKTFHIGFPPGKKRTKSINA
jgi:lactoylglutathione lyase